MSLNIAFHCNQADNRGTGVAIYDYAHFNEILLNNKSICLIHNYFQFLFNI